MKRSWLVLCVFILLLELLPPLPHLGAQTTPSVTYYICVIPAYGAEIKDDTDPYPTFTTPYLLAVEGNPMWFIPAHAANMVIYSQGSVRADSYKIVPDAQIDGYRTTGLQDSSVTSQNTPTDLQCGDVSPLITDNLNHTGLLAISPEVGVFIRDAQADLIVPESLENVAAIHFRRSDPTTPYQRLDFQIAELDTTPNEVTLSLPSLVDPYEMVLFSNQNVLISTNSLEHPTEFWPGTGARNYQRLNDDIMANNAAAETFPQIVSNGAFRIYPAYGLVNPYQPGTSVRIQIQPIETDPKRQFCAQEDVQLGCQQAITSLDLPELKVYCYLTDPATGGTMDRQWDYVEQDQGRSLTSNGVDTHGQIHVMTFVSDTRPVEDCTIIETWLVEIADPTMVEGAAAEAAAEAPAAGQ